MERMKANSFPYSYFLPTRFLLFLYFCDMTHPGFGHPSRRTLPYAERHKNTPNPLPINRDKFRGLCMSNHVAL